MTMIELLTVIVIVGLLAAIAVPAFLHHRDRATDATAQASARAAQAAAAEVAGENEGRFDGPDGVSVESLRRTEPVLEGVEIEVPMVTDDAFIVRVRSETGNTFDVRRNPDGSIDLACASADDAGCPSDGTWD